MRERNTGSGGTGRRLRWLAAAACLCLAAGAVRFAWAGLHPAPAGEGNGGGTGNVYMSYAGPVFPLSADREDLTADRETAFDFSPYATATETEGEGGGARVWETWQSRALVTDRYRVAGPGGPVTFLYPFAASLASSPALRPEITVDGAAAETVLRPGPSPAGFRDGTGRSLDRPASWEDYRALLEAGYGDRAFDPPPALDRTVAVYEVTDRFAPAGREGGALRLTFPMDFENTALLTWGFTGGRNDPAAGTCARICGIPASDGDGGERAWLIVLGEDVGEIALDAWTDGSCQNRLKDAGGTVVRTETTLGEILGRAADRYLETGAALRTGGGETLLDSLPPSVFRDLAAEVMGCRGLLSDGAAPPHDQGEMLEDVFSETLTMDRVMYLAFPAELPAAGTVEIAARMTKNPSRDFTGPDRERNGYDLATRLGSALTCTSQTASLLHPETVELGDQDFGFDPENGVLTVTLDPAREHYFLEVRKAED